MEILVQSFGEYQTNCYICKLPFGEIVIDAGMGASEWVANNCPKPLAFLNTHGHFDHIWSNASLKSLYPNTPLITPELDAFMLESDCFGTGVSPSQADILIPCHKNSYSLRLGEGLHKGLGGESGKEQGVEVIFSHYPGHTPGCCIVEIEGHIFSGDFIFYRSIGRSDFPYSNIDDMIESLQRFKALPSEPNKPIYPGHGQSTSLKDEQRNVEFWIRHLGAEKAQQKAYGY